MGREHVGTGGEGLKPTGECGMTSFPVPSLPVS